MGTKATNLGEFIDLVYDPKNMYEEMWLQDCEFLEFGAGKWAQIRRLPLTRETVIQLSQKIASKIAEEAANWSEEGPYQETLRHGHAFLQRIHRTAVEQGISVGLQEIDTPLTPTESMVAAGLVTLQDGRVQLTAEGERAAREVGQQKPPERG